jgi:hypothetical protein
LSILVAVTLLHLSMWNFYNIIQGAGQEGCSCTSHERAAYFLRSRLGELESGRRGLGELLFVCLVCTFIRQ